MEKEVSNQDIISVLADVASAVVGYFKMKDLLGQIIQTTMKTLNAEVCSIFLEDREKEPGIIRCEAGSGFAERIVGKATYKIGEGLTGYVAKTGETQNIKGVEDIQNFKNAGIWQGKYDKEQWESDKSLYRNGIVLPLKIKDQILGVIKVENKIKKYGDFFSDADVMTLKTIANVIALAIENVRLHQQVEMQLKVISSKAAHRINNQATNYDYIELALAKEAVKASPDKNNLLFLLEKLRNTTVNLKRMVNAFKEFGKPLELKKELSQPNKIIQDEVDAMLENLSIQIHLELSSDIPAFKLDAARFSESVKELLQNAKKAIGEGKKGNIHISTQLLHRNISGPKEWVRIVMEDDGPGIPEKFPLFTPFQTTNPQGTGLGLSTVKELVEAHGGNIQHIRKQGKGACFEIEIPIERGES